MHKRAAPLSWLCLTIVACAGPQSGQRLAPAASAESPGHVSVTTGAEAGPARAASSPSEAAHRELVATVSCWFGGLWSDAQGAREQDRTAAAKLRCQELVRRLNGRDDADRVERLRSLESSAVAEVTDQILAIAKNEKIDADRQQDLAKLLRASAEVARETMYARRAADNVKRDILAGQSEASRASDEAASVDPLSKDQALLALLQLDARDLTHDARSIGLLFAMDRMNVARGLPKRLKVITLQGTFTSLFGVAAPDADTRKPLEGGVWLTYLRSVAKGAGHPVSEKAKSLAAQERMAWGGAVMGLADKLQVEAVQLSDATELKHVTSAVVKRVQTEYQASEAATLATPKAELPLEDETWP